MKTLIGIVLVSICSIFCSSGVKSEDTIFKRLVFDYKITDIQSDTLCFDAINLIKQAKAEIFENNTVNGKYDKDFFCLIMVVRERYGIILNEKLVQISKKSKSSLITKYNFYSDCEQLNSMEEAMFYLTCLERDILLSKFVFSDNQNAR